MNNKFTGNFQVEPEEIKKIARQKQKRPNLLRNTALAFISGGVLCVMGQLVYDFFVGLGFTVQEAANPTIAVFILLGSLATGLGVYDNIAHYTGAGTGVPVTGFANSITAAAMEFRKEGLVTGVGSKMFMLAGSVIVFGVVTAFIIGLISAIL